MGIHRGEFEHSTPRIARGDLVLVTGATGFVGRNVVKALRAGGKQVRCLVHTRGREKVVTDYHVEVAYGDVLNSSSLRAAMEGVVAVVHLVATIREKGSANFDLINRRGTELVVEAAREEGVRHFVHLSAIGARENPKYPYLSSKWQGEQAVIKSGLTYTIIRPSIQFGEGDEFINTLGGVVRAFPLAPVLGSGKTRFQPICAEEVGACVSLVVDNPQFGGQVVEIGGPDYLTYDEIVDIVAKALKVRRIKARLPLALVKRIVRVMGAVLPRPPATVSQLDMLAIDNVTAIDSVEQMFKMKPRPLVGNIGYVRRMSRWDAWRIAFGFMPLHIRDH